MGIAQAILGTLRPQQSPQTQFYQAYDALYAAYILAAVILTLLAYILAHKISAGNVGLTLNTRNKSLRIKQCQLV
jgi:hypothetical protein